MVFADKSILLFYIQWDNVVDRDVEVALSLHKGVPIHFDMLTNAKEMQHDHLKCNVINLIL